MNIVILAAGSGTRMLSDKPKVLHNLAGKPLIHYVIKTACKLNPSKLVIVLGKENQDVENIIQKSTTVKVNIVIQHEQLGTGHALKQALPVLNHAEKTLILYADVPLIDEKILKALIQKEGSTSNSLSILTTVIKDPTGYGRILRNAANSVYRIVEEKAASQKEREVCEVNTGIMTAPTHKLMDWLKKINKNNEQKEFLLTDIIPLALKDGIKISTIQIEHNDHALGVNNREQLAQLERQTQLSFAKKILKRGVTLADPNRFDLRGQLECGKDVFIDINALIEGTVKIGDRVTIGANCILKNCTIGDESIVEPFSFIDSSEIGRNTTIGPYARIRPGTKLADNTKVGNFVEIKNSTLNQKTKINHLSYIGDTIIGKNVNIGAGTITCNYDGEKKYQTIIGDNVFVGSDCQLIAPLKIGSNKMIAAGTTVWRDIPNPSKELVLNTKIQQCSKLRSKKD